jgi:hypothetical protein
VDGFAADLMVGVEQRLSEQIAYVSATEAVDDSAAVSLALDEPGEAELGEVLAGHSGTTPGHLGQRGNVGVAVA